MQRFRLGQKHFTVEYLILHIEFQLLLQKIKDLVSGGSLTSPVSHVEARFYPLLFTTIILPLPKKYEFASLLRIHLSSQVHTGVCRKTKGNNS